MKTFLRTNIHGIIDDSNFMSFGVNEVDKEDKTLCHPKFDIMIFNNELSIQCWKEYDPSKNTLHTINWKDLYTLIKAKDKINKLLDEIDDNLPDLQHAEDMLNLLKEISNKKEEE